MSQTEGKKLDKGDPFPKLELKVVDGGSFTIPNGLNAKWSVLLFYRGLW